MHSSFLSVLQWQNECAEEAFSVKSLTTPPQISPIFDQGGLCQACPIFNIQINRTRSCYTHFPPPPLTPCCTLSWTTPKSKVTRIRSPWSFHPIRFGGTDEPIFSPQKISWKFPFFSSRIAATLSHGFREKWDRSLQIHLLHPWRDLARDQRVPPSNQLASEFREHEHEEYFFPPLFFSFLPPP